MAIQSHRTNHSIGYKRGRWAGSDWFAFHAFEHEVLLRSSMKLDEGIELNHKQLRTLGQQLMDMADDAERYKRGAKR